MPIATVMEQKGVYLPVCESKERDVQVCSKESKDLFQGAAGPGDTGELMLLTT